MSDNRIELESRPHVSNIAPERSVGREASLVYQIPVLSPNLMMIHFSRSAAAQFRSLKEIAGKSPFFYMSRQKQNPVVFSCRCKGYLIVAFRVSHTPAINLPHNSVATIQCYERFNRVG